MCGNTFFVGPHRVEETSGGFWVYPRGGQRGRFFPHGTAIAQSLKGGSGDINPEVRARTNKAGTHEPVYYLRDAEGRIGVPPAPGLDVPEGCTLHEARSLQEIDSITREMNRDLFQQFYDDGYATQIIDKALGSPIEMLKEQLQHPISRMERDVIPMLIDELDKMERDNRKIDTRTFFRSRES